MTRTRISTEMMATITNMGAVLFFGSSGLDSLGRTDRLDNSGAADEIGL